VTVSFRTTRCNTLPALRSVFEGRPKLRLLNADEERQLSSAIASGDLPARKEMVSRNLGLLHTIARAYGCRGLDLDDLVSEGYIGLIRAAKEYDPAFGNRFSTYAAYWIKQAIRHALINTTAPIRLPAHMVKLLSKWGKAERALTRELGQSPTFDQVAVALGLTDAHWVLVKRAKMAGRLRPEGSEDEGRSPHETCAPGEWPGAEIERADEADDFRNSMEGRLDNHERTIVLLRFGLNGGDPMTLREVGRRLGVTREWVSRIEKRAIAKLHG
jgi:RNA polymerase primary sigma factor